MLVGRSAESGFASLPHLHGKDHVTLENLARLTIFQEIWDVSRWQDDYNRFLVHQELLP
jgi:hypothetical protein